MELKTNTAVRIPVGPLVDPTDGKTAETALTVTDLSVQIYQTKTDGSAVVRTQFAPTASGGNNDMALVTSSTDGVYDLELTAAQLNFLGNARLSVYDLDGFLVWWVDIHVVSANYFDNKYGSTLLKVDMDTIKTQTVTCAAGVTINPSVGAATIQPTNTQFEARTIPSADYTIVSDLGTVQTADHTASVAAILEDTGTTIPGTITTLQGNVTSILEDTGTTIPGTITTAQADLDILTGVDGVTLATLQANYAPNKTTPPTTAEIKTAIEAAGSHLTLILEDTGTTLDALVKDIPTTAELALRTLPSDDYVVVGDTLARVTLVDTVTTNTDMLTAAAINAEVDTALNTALPAAGSTVADSFADYIRRMKYEIVNKKEITEADGASVTYADDDTTAFSTVAAAYTSDSTTTTRKRLE